ncbi:hypothetical protein SAMN02745148_03254 [Modicisalibacter ilicicola DSM 19980]|uniref:Uncharacterized protein n=1 Tax=Modicisalibacter ilicicola DSM 19980 TaxID=1121942 RepID=A0A1M5DKS7_9GAMM|nr:hypothetical protein SAMN02745148_03254 [Halomonas ilicicola DSM 19980]
MIQAPQVCADPTRRHAQHDPDCCDNVCTCLRCLCRRHITSRAVASR